MGIWMSFCSAVVGIWKENITHVNLTVGTKVSEVRGSDHQGTQKKTTVCTNVQTLTLWQCRMQNKRISTTSIGISWHTTGHLEQQKEEYKHFQTMTIFKHSWRLGSSQMWTRTATSFGNMIKRILVSYRRWCGFFHLAFSLFSLGVYFDAATLHERTPSWEERTIWILETLHVWWQESVFAYVSNSFWCLSYGNPEHKLLSKTSSA